MSGSVHIYNITQCFKCTLVVSEVLLCLLKAQKIPVPLMATPRKQGKEFGSVWLATPVTTPHKDASTYS